MLTTLNLLCQIDRIIHVWFIFNTLIGTVNSSNIEERKRAKDDPWSNLINTWKCFEYLNHGFIIHVLDLCVICILLASKHLHKIFCWTLLYAVFRSMNIMLSSLYL